MQSIMTHSTHQHHHAMLFAADHHQSSSHSDVSDCDSSVGPQEDIKPFQYDDVARAKLAPSVLDKSAAFVASITSKPAPRVLSLEEKLEALTAAMAFLPLADLRVAREAGPLFEAAASRIAPRPFADAKDMVFYRYSPQFDVAPHHHQASRFGMPTHANTTVMIPRGFAPQQAPASTHFHWRCLSCGNLSVGPRNCNTCRQPLAVSACRVFLGQIRKDLSAETATAMVRVLAPHVTVLHMESHTNPIDGRGKGCAWAYVDSVEDALALTALHKRIFVDLDDDDAEGFWFVQDAALMPRLAAMAEEVGAFRNRPQWLPRQPLVAELPARSMLAQYVRAL